MEFYIHAIFSIYPEYPNKLLANSGFQMLYNYAFSLCRCRKLRTKDKTIRKMHVNAKYYTKNTTILNTILKIQLFYYTK